MGCCCSSSDSQDITPVPDRPNPGANPVDDFPPATAFGGDGQTGYGGNG